MNALCNEIAGFLQQNGFGCEILTLMGQEVICVQCSKGQCPAVRCVVPHEVNSSEVCEALGKSECLNKLMQCLDSDGIESVVITEDRWRLHGDMMRDRLLAHLEMFTPLYARNCEVRKIDKGAAADFLRQNHSYGDAACRYRYGLYLRRPSRCGRYDVGTLVAVATFSNARKWQKGDKVIRSYEWTRYASLPGVRISGGMGKMLKAFIMDVSPDDIMSYADLEWSEGRVYEQLGFTLEGKKDPVVFMVDKTWRRTPIREGMAVEDQAGVRGDRFFQNSGSNKYRLKLTQYE